MTQPCDTLLSAPAGHKNTTWRLTNIPAKFLDPRRFPAAAIVGSRAQSVPSGSDAYRGSTK